MCLDDQLSRPPEIRLGCDDERILSGALRFDRRGDHRQLHDRLQSPHARASLRSPPICNSQRLSGVPAAYVDFVENRWEPWPRNSRRCFVRQVTPECSDQQSCT